MMTQTKHFDARGVLTSFVMDASECPEAMEAARGSLFAEYRRAGISAIPVALDGSKQSLVPWKPYEEVPPTDREVAGWLLSYGSANMGIAVVTGRVSGGMEVLDFDNGYLLEPFIRSCPPGLVERLPVIKTPSGGWHIYYRSPEVCPSMKIAMMKDGEVGIESRGEGAYVIAVGSPPETHPDKLPYVQRSGPRFPLVPSISIEERTALWLAARRFDERHIIETAVQKRVSSVKSIGPSYQRNARAMPRLCDQMSWGDILRPMGWTSIDEIRWIRPGKTDPGISANVNVALDGTEILTVFSSNAGALAPTDGHKSWNKFAAYAALYHEGDWKVALVELHKIKVR